MDKLTIITSCDGRQIGKIGSHRFKRYSELAVRLVRSIRMNGGEHADLPILTFFRSDFPPYPEHEKQLKDLGCQRRPIYPEKSHPPLFQKILSCALTKSVSTPYAMWMDTDMYMYKGALEQLIEGVEGAEVGASPSTWSTHKWARPEDNHLWQKMYEVAGIDPPKERVLSHIDKKLANFYFCSGLVIYKTGLGFPEKWYEMAEKVLSLGEDFVQSFTQTSLSLAMSQYKHWAVPEDLQYFYTLHKKKLSPSVKIVHYQDERVTEVPDEYWNI